MTTKLTLHLNKGIIEEAKAYAKENKVSLSKLIENHLTFLMRKTYYKKEVSPLVKDLTGVIPQQSGDRVNDDYYEYLSKKYS